MKQIETSISARAIPLRIGRTGEVEVMIGRYQHGRFKLFKFGFPSGGIKENELVKDAMARELAEETGLRGACLSHTPYSFHDVVESPELQIRRKVELFYAAFLIAGGAEPVDTDEMKENQFIPIGELEAFYNEMLHFDVKAWKLFALPLVSRLFPRCPCCA